MNTMTEAKNLAAASEPAPGSPLRMTASEAFVETLVAHKVRDVFGLVGLASLDALDLFPGAGIRLYGTAHEQSAAHMADGYGRVTRRPAVCVAPNGPGIIHFVTGVAAAYRARTPMVVVTPESAGTAAGPGGFPVADPMSHFSTITHWQARVDSPLLMADLLHRAFAIAQEERGPVQVSIPRDHFHGEGDYRIRPPFAVEPAAGGAALLEKAAKLLAEAKNPAIIAGDGVVTAGGVEEVKALAEYLTAPVANAYRHNDSFPASHPLACGPLGHQGSMAAMRLLARADTVLVLGGEPQPGNDGWPAGAKVIRVDVDRHAPVPAVEGALAIRGDARLAVAGILKRLKARGARKPDKARLAEIQREKEAWIAELANGPSPNRKGVIGSRRALAQLSKALPRNAIVSTDAGNVCSVANGYLRFEEAPSFLAPAGGGGRGYAWPIALGAKVARPDRPAIAYVGDRAWSKSLAEVMTAVKEKIPAVAVVFNNGQWGAEKKGPADLVDSRVAAGPLVRTDFSEVARVMGAEGYRVEHEDEVSDALKAALKSGKPSVVEILLAREPGEASRRDAARKPRRLLPKYRR